MCVVFREQDSTVYKYLYVSCTAIKLLISCLSVVHNECSYNILSKSPNPYNNESAL